MDNIVTDTNDQLTLSEDRPNITKGQLEAPSQSPNIVGLPGELSRLSTESTSPQNTQIELPSSSSPFIPSTTGIPPWLIGNPNVNPVPLDIPNYSLRALQQITNPSEIPPQPETTRILPPLYATPSTQPASNSHVSDTMRLYTEDITRRRAFMNRQGLAGLVDRRPLYDSQSNSIPNAPISESVPRSLDNAAQGLYRTLNQRHEIPDRGILGNIAEQTGDLLNLAGAIVQDTWENTLSLSPLTGQNYTRTQNAGMNFLEDFVSPTDENGNESFDITRGYFGSQGRGALGAANYVLSMPQNIVMASIYSTADLAQTLASGLTYTNGNLGYDMTNVHSPASSNELFHRYSQVFGGEDLSFTNMRVAGDDNYMALIPQDAPREQQLLWGAAGFILDVLTGGIVDSGVDAFTSIVRPTVQGLRQGMNVPEAISYGQRIARTAREEVARQVIPSFGTSSPTRPESAVSASRLANITPDEFARELSNEPLAPVPLPEFYQRSNTELQRAADYLGIPDMPPINTPDDLYQYQLNHGATFYRYGVPVDVDLDMAAFDNNPITQTPHGLNEDTGVIDASIMPSDVQLDMDAFNDSPFAAINAVSRSTPPTQSLNQTIIGLVQDAKEPLNIATLQEQLPETSTRELLDALAHLERDRLITFGVSAEGKPSTILLAPPSTSSDLILDFLRNQEQPDTALLGRVPPTISDIQEQYPNIRSDELYNTLNQLEQDRQIMFTPSTEGKPALVSIVPEIQRFVEEAQGIRELEHSVIGLRNQIDATLLESDNVLPIGNIADEINTRAAYNETTPGTQIKPITQLVEQSDTPINKEQYYYHGTRQQGEILGTIDYREGGAHEYGVGLYLSDDPHQATTAANAARLPNNPIPGTTRLSEDGTGRLLQLSIENARTFEINEPINPDIYEEFTHTIENLMGSNVADEYYRITNRNSDSRSLWLSARVAYRNVNGKNIPELMYHNFSVSMAHTLRRDYGFDSIYDAHRGITVGLPHPVSGRVRGVTLSDAPVGAVDRTQSIRNRQALMAHLSKGFSSEPPSVYQHIRDMEVQTRRRLLNSIAQENVDELNRANKRFKPNVPLTTDIDNSERVVANIINDPVPFRDSTEFEQISELPIDWECM